MKVTSVKVKPYKDARTHTVAYVTLTLDEALVITNARIVSGPKGLFLAMPSRMLKDKDGNPKKKENGKIDFKDIVYPRTPEARAEMEEAAIEEFNKVKGEAGFID